MLTSVPIPLSEVSNTIRDVWHFENDAWTNLKCDSKACDWRRLEPDSVDVAVNYFLVLLVLKCEEHIPQGKNLIKRRTHPWLDDGCGDAIIRKSNVMGSEAFDAAQAECAATLKALATDMFSN